MMVKKGHVHGAHTLLLWAPQPWTVAATGVRGYRLRGLLQPETRGPVALS